MKDAIKATGLSKATIHRAIKSGKLTASKDDNSHYQIDPAELARVYPNKFKTLEQRDDETAHEPSQDSSHTVSKTSKRDGKKTAEQAHEIELLKIKLEAAEAMASERGQQVDDLKDRLNEAEKERKTAQAQVTALLTDERPNKPKGFWDRLRKG
jgi:hypothetical protein